MIAREDPIAEGCSFPRNSVHVWPGWAEESRGKADQPHIAASDWLIGKPNSSKLIGIINSTRAETGPGGEERVAARKSEESKPGEETFKKSTRHSESERAALSVGHLNLS